MSLHFITAYISSSIILFIFDVIWLFTMYKGFYRPNLNHLLTETPKYLPIIFFYLLYPLGSAILVVLPALNAHHSLLKIYLTGTLLGLIAYGTYNLTNQATLKNWPVFVTIIDMLWGSILTGGVCLISAYITKAIAGSFQEL